MHQAGLIALQGAFLKFLAYQAFHSFVMVCKYAQQRMHLFTFACKTVLDVFGSEHMIRQLHLLEELLCLRLQAVEVSIQSTDVFFRTDGSDSLGVPAGGFANLTGGGFGSLAVNVKAKVDRYWAALVI